MGLWLLPRCDTRLAKCEAGSSLSPSVPEGCCLLQQWLVSELAWRAPFSPMVPLTYPGQDLLSIWQFTLGLYVSFWMCRSLFGPGVVMVDFGAASWPWKHGYLLHSPYLNATGMLKMNSLTTL